jgi:LPS-assembly protein
LSPLFSISLRGEGGELQTVQPPNEFVPHQILTVPSLVWIRLPFLVKVPPLAQLQSTGRHLRGSIPLRPCLVLCLLLGLRGEVGLCQQTSPGKPEASASPVQLLVGEEILTIRAVHQEQTEKHKYLLRGKAEIDYRDMKFFADEMTYDDETGDVEAGGGVRFEREVETITGTRLKMNVVSKTGVIYDAKGKANPNFYFEGAEIHKIGEDKYKIIDGMVTACKGEVPKWSFHTQSAVISVEKSVFLQHATFKIKGLPLFYFPYAAAPVTKRERQTGFLIPTTGSSTQKGRTLGDAFYWAMNRSADLLLTGEYFSARGWAEELQFRARPSETNYINVFGFHVNDRKNQGGQSAKVGASYVFSNGFRAVADVNYVSSLTFRQVFGDSFNAIVLPDQTSQAFVGRNFDSYSLNFDVYRNETFFDQGAVILRRFPAAEFSVMPRAVRDLPIYFSLDSAVDGIHRADPGFSTPNITQRFDFAPRITFPLPGNWGRYFTPSFEFRETVYRSRFHSPNPLQDALNRTTGEVRLDFRGFGLERIYEHKGGRFGDRFKHVIEPEVTYRLVRGVSDIDQIIRFDERDVVVNTNEIEYGVTNRIYARRDAGSGSEQARELLSWKISQKYFFDPTLGGAIVPGRRNVFDALQDLTGFAFSDGPRRFSPIVSLLRFSPRDGWSGDFRVDYDTQLHQIRNSSVTANVSNPGRFLSFTYFLTRQHDPLTIASNQLRATFGVGNFNKPGISSAFSISYDLKRSTIQNSVVQLGYNWDCCGVTLEFREFNIGLRNETQFRFSFSLLNVGSFGNLKRQERLF